MTNKNKPSNAAETSLRRLYVYNGGFLTQKRIRRILALAGYDICVGAPKDKDAIGVWGNSPTSHRGEKVSDLTDTPIVRVEDSFLRSVRTGRDGDPPIGLNIDKNGVHFDPSTRSDLENILTENPLDDAALLNRAKGAMAQIKRLHLSKYNDFDLDLEPPKPGYVLVIDQTRNDASVKASKADLNTFREMLYYAQEEHPNARIIIKTHPETNEGHRGGYFTHENCNDRISICDDRYSPYALFDGAIAVYTVSSQLGFEAILTGHKPIVFGQPFYAGWGLSDDRAPIDRRQRNLTRTQLFAAAMILYPTWYDPYRDKLCELEDVIATLSAQSKAWQQDCDGWQAAGIKLWKRKHFQEIFGRAEPVKFIDNTAENTPETQKKLMIWGSRVTDTHPTNRPYLVEDGFIRSKGLGANLVPPLSLVCENTGIYYDATRPSHLEELIQSSTNLPDAALRRAEKLIAKLNKRAISKYNIGEQTLPPLPEGRRILVPGQVEDDASLRLGACEFSTNLELLRATRSANPAAVIIYKPHPDVEAGLRDGKVENAEDYADVVLNDIDAPSAIDAVDEVWTMTSLLGFEALLRGKRVTCFGMPFYAGWGLTDDRAKPIPRRSALPSLPALAHAVLVDYPRYYDPVTKQPCPPEVAIERIADMTIPKTGLTNRVLSKMQSFFASYSRFWR